MAPPETDVSILLRAWSDGDQSAFDKLAPIVYDELRRLAAHYMKQERSGHSLQATALVNEAYLRLVDYKRMRWENRAHFFAVSAQLMRGILVDHARRRNLLKVNALPERMQLAVESGAKRILIPSENKRDVADVPDAILTAIQWQFYDSPTRAVVLGLGLA